MDPRRSHSEDPDRFERRLGAAWRARLRVSRLLAGSVLLMTACGSENLPAVDAPPPVISLEQDLRIDGHQETLTPVTWMGVSPDGAIALVLWQEHRVRFYDEAGGALGSVGREGEGPGEFMRPVRAGWIGDTLWVSDTQIGRVSWISPERDVVRTQPHPPGAEWPVGRGDGRTFARAYPYAVYPDGSTLVSVIPSGGSGDDAGLPVFRTTWDGVIEREIIEIPRDASSVRVEVDGGFLFGTIPFYPEVDWAVSPRGARIGVLATRDLDPTSGAYRVTVVDARGEEVFSREIAYEPVPVPDPVRDSAIQRVADRGEGVVRREMADRLREATPAFFPEAERLVLGSGGRVWVGLRERNDGNPWLVLSPAGEPWGRAVLPSNVRLETVTRTHVYGTERDEFDVESVVRYRIGRTR